MSDISAEHRIELGKPLTSPLTRPTIIFEKKEKKKKKIKLPEPLKKDIDVVNSDDDKHDSESENDTSSKQSSTSSGSDSSTSFSFPFVDGPRYAEEPDDRLDRKAYHKKKKGKRGRSRKVKIVDVQSRDTSLESFHSELVDIEQFENANGTSKAVRRLWKAIEELKKRVTLVENSESGSSSEEKPKKRKKKKGKGKIAKKKYPVEVKLENDNAEDDKPSEITTSLSKNDLNDGLTSDEAKDDMSARSSELPEKEDIDRKPTNSPPKDGEKPFELLAKDDGLGANDPKVSDSDSEDSGYDIEDEEKHDAQRIFELKTQFFYRSDEEQRKLFNSTEIFPFIRVRWDDPVTTGETDTIILDAEKKNSEVIPGHIDILEIFIESPVFLKFLGELATNLPVQPVSILPGGRSYLETISFYKPFRWLIHNREHFQVKLNKLEEEKRSVLVLPLPKLTSTGCNPTNVISNPFHLNAETGATGLI